MSKKTRKGEYIVTRKHSGVLIAERHVEKSYHEHLKDLDYIEVSPNTEYVSYKVTSDIDPNSELPVVEKVEKIDLRFFSGKMTRAFSGKGG